MFNPQPQSCPTSVKSLPVWNYSYIAVCPVCLLIYCLRLSGTCLSLCLSGTVFACPEPHMYSKCLLPHMHRACVLGCPEHNGELLRVWNPLKSLPVWNHTCILSVCLYIYLYINMCVLLNPPMFLNLVLCSTHRCFSTW